MEWAKLDPDERRRRLRVVSESRKPTVMPVEGASPWHGLLLSTSSDDVCGIVRHNVTPDALRAKRGHHGYAFVRLDLKEPSNSMCFAHGCDVSKAGRPGQDCRHLRLLRRLHTQHVLDGGGGPTTLSLTGALHTSLVAPTVHIECAAHVSDVLKQSKPRYEATVC